MIYKLSIIIATLFILQGCQGTHQEKLEQLDKVYGKCDNPHRQIRGLEYKICKDKERAAGPDGEIGEPLDVRELIDGITGKRTTTIAASDTNSYLWDAALSVLDKYALKIIDFEGGYIETDWILQKDLPNQRCLIKTHITSIELLSTGVDVKIVCQNFIDGTWYMSEDSLTEEEKQLTLKILSEAQKKFNQQSS